MNSLILGRPAKGWVSQSIISPRTVCQTSGSLSAETPSLLLPLLSPLPPPRRSCPHPTPNSNNNKNSSGPILLPEIRRSFFTLLSSPSHQSRGLSGRVGGERCSRRSCEFRSRQTAPAVLVLIPLALEADTPPIKEQ